MSRFNVIIWIIKISQPNDKIIQETVRERKPKRQKLYEIALKIKLNINKLTGIVS